MLAALCSLPCVPADVPARCRACPDIPPCVLPCVRADARAQEWNQRYDTEVTRLQQDLSRLSSQRDAGLQAIRAAEERFRTEQKSLADRIELEQRVHERDVRRRRAVVIVQSLFRGRRARRAVAALRAELKKAAKAKKGKSKSPAKGRKK